VESIISAAKDAPEEAKNRAANIGDFVHKWAEEYSKDQHEKAAYNRMLDELGSPSDEDKVKIDTGISALVKWFEKEKVEFLAAEQIIYSKKHGYTGKFDAIVRINGKIYLVDYKTSNGVYGEHYFQSSSYLKAKEEEIGERYFDGALIVGIVKEDKLDREGNVVKQAGSIIPVFRSRADLVKDFKVFKALIPIKDRMSELDAEYFKNRKKATV
jgi:hypothetical protein